MRKRSLLSNSGIVLFTQVWSVFLSLFTTPYIIKKLGTDAYGILSLIIVLTGYLSFLDLGFGWGLIKYIAEFRAKDDRDAIKKTVETSLFVFLSLGLVASLALILSAAWVTNSVFNIPRVLVPEAVKAIRISAVGFLLSFLIVVLSSFFKGVQRFDLSNITQTFFNSSYVIGTVILLIFGKGLIEIVWLSLLLNGLALLAHILLANRLLPGIARLPRFHKPYFKMLAGFSFFSMLSRLGMLAIYQIDKFFVAYFLPISMLSYYVVPFNLSQKLNFMGSNIASVAMPFATEKISTHQEQSFRQTYYRIAKSLWLLTLAPTMVVLVFSNQILRLWISPEFSRQGTIPLIFLAAGFFIISVATLEAVTIDASGKPQVNAFFLITAGAANFVLCLLLTKYFSIIGTGVALFISLLCLAIAVIYYSHKYILRTERFEYLRSVIIPFLKVLFITTPLLIIFKWLISNLIILIILSLLSMLGIILTGYLIVFNREEKESIKGKIYDFYRQLTIFKSRKVIVVPKSK